MGDLSREEFVGRRREPEASLSAGVGTPTHAEAVLAKAAR